MQNFTEEQKQAIDDANAQVKFVAFNPNLTDEPAPPEDYVEYYREESANLVEIIYTNPAVV